MCARRFLNTVVVLTLIAVAAGFAIHQFGDRILIRQAKPYGHYTAPNPNQAPDFTLASSWLALPGRQGSPASWLPDGADAPRTKGDAAIFYVHPTTYLERDRWNAPLHPGGVTELRSRLFVQTEASALNGAGAIWAPRYRQAAYGAFLLSSVDSHQALGLAYRDIASAFDHFLKQTGERPIILAGHSQGSLLITQLLKNRVAGTDLAKRVAVAYLAGWPISLSVDLPVLGLPACQSPRQTGCLVNWMSFKDPANPGHLFNSWQNEDGLTGEARPANDMLCVNPLTGSARGSAGPVANPGTLVPDLDFKAAKLEPRRVGATCRNGLLIIDGDIPDLGPFVLPGNNYHVYDYALFWGAIRRDAKRRLAAWPR